MLSWNNGTYVSANQTRPIRVYLRDEKIRWKTKPSILSTSILKAHFFLSSRKLAWSWKVLRWVGEFQLLIKNEFNHFEEIVTN